MFSIHQLDGSQKVKFSVRCIFEWLLHNCAGITKNLFSLGYTPECGEWKSEPASATIIILLQACLRSRYSGALNIYLNLVWSSKFVLVASCVVLSDSFLMFHSWCSWHTVCTWPDAEFETPWPQALLMHCYGVSSCSSEHSPPSCFCFLSLPFPYALSNEAVHRYGGLQARCYPNYGYPCWSLFKESACLDDVLIFRTGGRVRIRTIEAEETESWSLEGRLLITRLKSQS